MVLAVPRLVIVREVSARYPACIRSSAEPIDLERARRQHAAYVERIRSLRIRVDVLPALDTHPDAVFVEDTAVVLGRRAVMTRPGAESRRGEVASVARSLEPLCEIATMEAPATLDGGDVLRAGARLFVGLSERTNEPGCSFLARIAEEEGVDVIRVPVAGGLHLKSSCTLLDERTVLLDPSCIDEVVFRAEGLRAIAAEEPIGANTLAIGETLLVSSQAPRTAARLATLGFTVVPVGVDEFHKGDGALTCLSLRVPWLGDWVT